MYDILDKFNDFKDIKRMSIEELNEFSSEIRQFLVEKVSKTGGHLASNLGVVELTLSLYNVFDFDKDKLIWDVGHQSYVHKILTGRKDKFDTLRKYGGLSGFPKYEESKYDMFETGHSSTSISAAVGMARARDIKHENYEVVSVIGDGALTGGMALEALNDLGFNKTKVIIVLNDNQMSISKNVGGISTYLSTLRTNPGYTKFKKDFNSTVNKIPNIGKHVTKSLEKFKNGIKQMIVPGMLFEDMGIEYLGPIDGHNIKDLSRVFSMAKNLNKPVIIHVITKKGKGYDFAEKNPGKFHGIGPFNSENGELKKNSGITYSKAFGNEILKLAKENKKIVAITAAMRDATGLGKFSTEFKERFFDVGIAEEHAVTMAAGMAKSGLIPVFAVYSTFLQRGYDQILHDVCMQDLHVILAIDRAGIVGEDGETHQGVFDLSYLSEMPNMTILTPKCTGELKYILKWAVNYNHPVAIRYPKGEDYDSIQISPLTEIKKGIWEVISGGDDIAIIACGKMLQKAVMAKSELMKNGINVMVINACFVKPIDKGLINELIQNDYKIVTIEDNIVHGGFGSMVLEYVNSLKPGSFVMNLGYKDSFIPHGNTELLYKINGLDVRGICESILKISK